MVNRVSSYFPKGGRSATQTELKNKVKSYQNSNTKTRNSESQQKYCLGTVINELLHVAVRLCVLANFNEST